MAIMEISVVPVGTGQPGISGYVRDCVKELEEAGEGISYEITAMGTIVQGDVERLLELAQRMHAVPFRSGAQRVLTSIKLDERLDVEASIEQKVRSVREKM